MAKTVTLGQRYKDSLHAEFEGVAVARHIYLHGCERVSLQYVKDGEIKTHNIDLPQLEGIEIPAEEKKPGGPPLPVPPARDTGGR